MSHCSNFHVTWVILDYRYDSVDTTRLSAMLPEHMDDGLTWAWALYWSASLSNGAGLPSTTVGPTTSTEAPEEIGAGLGSGVSAMSQMMNIQDGS